VNLERAGRHLFQASEVLEELAELSSLGTITRIDHDTAFVRGVTSVALAFDVLLAGVFVVVALPPEAEGVLSVFSFIDGVVVVACLKSAVSRLLLARRKHREWRALQEKHQARVTVGHQELRQVALAIQGRGA